MIGSIVNNKPSALSKFEENRGQYCDLGDIELGYIWDAGQRAVPTIIRELQNMYHFLQSQKLMVWKLLMRYLANVLKSSWKLKEGQEPGLSFDFEVISNPTPIHRFCPLLCAAFSQLYEYLYQNPMHASNLRSVLVLCFGGT